MNIVTPILSPRVANYGNVGHFPNISARKVFSPLKTHTQGKFLSYKMMVMGIFAL